MAELTPTEAFVTAMKRAKRSGNVSQATLASRLRELGSPLSQSAIADIERGKRRVTLDEALAIAAALGVAPVHMIVPFEAEEELRAEYRVRPGQGDEPAPDDVPPVVTTAADVGVFEAVDELKIGAVVLTPIDARGWVRGRRLPLPLLADPQRQPEEERRFYFNETPPPRRYQLRELARQALGRRKGRARIPPAEDAVPTSRIRLLGRTYVLQADVAVALETVVAEPNDREEP